MRNLKIAKPALAILVAMVVFGHSAYSIAPASRRKTHSGRLSKQRTARKNSKLCKTTQRAAHPAGPVYTVIATTYQAMPSQTDSQPFVTADNSTIRRGYSSRQRWLAVSQDLLKQGGGRIHYGDKVRVRGVSSKLDGLYTVHDTMHKRHRHRIDILSNPREKMTLSAPNVKLQLATATPTRKRPARMSRLAAKEVKKHSRLVVSRSAHSRRREKAKRAVYLTAAIL